MNGPRDPPAPKLHGAQTKARSKRRAVQLPKPATPKVATVGAPTQDVTRQAAYAAALKTGVRTVVQTVQDMHHSISDKAFGSVQHVPGLAMPARMVQGVHDAISHGVYAAVRQGSGALLSAAGVVEKLTVDASKAATGPARKTRNALNGVFGDALAQRGNSLALTMGFHQQGSALPLTRKSLGLLRPRVCVFIHGLACDEHSWQGSPQAWAGTPWEHSLAAGEAIHYGALLAKEFGDSAIYLRYNTGLPVADNAGQLAEQLQQLVAAAPASMRELVLVCHSMGGLVARSACELAAASGQPWPSRVRMLVCLGTPSQGAPLEQLGHLASLALNLTKVTQPLGRLANARSQGIKDLRTGLKAQRAGRATPPPRPMALRLIAANLGDAPGSAMHALVGRTLGDGLVLPASAVDHGLAGDVQRVELAGLGHMALLNHPRVYVQLRQWLIEAGSEGSSAAG